MNSGEHSRSSEATATPAAGKEQTPGDAATAPLPPDAETWHLTLAYDGANFHGWQIQPGLRTVQDELQKRLRLLLHLPELRVAATSRTDAGVHALDQHVSFAAPPNPELSPETLRRTLNRWLPQDMQVLGAARAAAGFHARHSAQGKAYTYVVCTGERCHPLFTRFVWHSPRPLDYDAMRRAAAFVTGEHDFSSFAVNPRREIESHVRTLHRVEVFEAGDLVCFNVVGNRFLYKMVRSLVGYLLHVGHGAVPAEKTPAVLAAQTRCAAADSAPAQGLFLARVFFEPDGWQRYVPVLPPFGWREGNT